MGNIQDILSRFHAANNNDDDGDASDNLPVSQAAPMPAVSAAPSDGSSDGEVNPLVKAYLQSRQDQALAQGAANSNQLLAGLARAGGTLSTALSGATPQSQSGFQQGYDALDKSASAPVTQVAAAQNDAMNAIRTKSALETAQTQSDQTDPDSDASQAFRKSIEANFPAIAKSYGSNWSSVSAADKDLIFDPIKLKETLDQKRQTTQARLDAQSDKADTRQSASQDKAMSATAAMLESARGNPAVAQAERDLYAADKANSLMNLGAGGDPNNLSMPQVRLLASEVGKIASGGVPSMHELDGLTPQTLAGKFSEVASNLMNSPTPANAGAFIKQYKDYADALTKDAQKTITDKYGRVIESHRSMLGPENYQLLKDQYLGRFSAPASSGSGKSAAGQHKPGDVVSVKGQNYTVGPDGDSLIPVGAGQ